MIFRCFPSVQMFILKNVFAATHHKTSNTKHVSTSLAILGFFQIGPVATFLVCVVLPVCQTTVSYFCFILDYKKQHKIK